MSRSKHALQLEQNRKQLLSAAENGVVGVVARILGENPSMADVVDSSGWSPLHLATQRAHAHVASLVLGVSPRLATLANEVNGLTAAHLAATQGYDNIMAQLLAVNPHAGDGRDKQGHTALHLAAKGAHDKIVSQLLVASPNLIDVKDHDGLNALHLAAKHGHGAVIHCILAARPEQKSSVGQHDWTALHWAAKEGHAKIVEQLMAAGADVTTRDKFGCTALHWAVKDNFVETVTQLLACRDGKQRVKLLLETDLNGRTALHWAATKNCEELAEMMIDLQPFLLEMIDSKHNTFLHSAIAAGRSKFVERLHTKKLIPAKVLRVLNSDAETPFQLALSTSGCTGAAETLKWSLDFDEIADAVFACNSDRTKQHSRRPVLSLEKYLGPVIEEQCESLRSALHKDVADTVFEYLFGPSKRQKTSTDS